VAAAEPDLDHAVGAKPASAPALVETLAH